MKKDDIKDISVVILAGGKSSRMGQDKSLMSFKSSDSMIQYQYKKLNKIFRKVYISSKFDKFDFLDDKSGLIIDTSNVFSPMIALDSIFDKLNEEKIFILSVDAPLLNNQTIFELINGFDKDIEIVIAKDKLNITHNLCGIFHRNIQKKIKECIKNDIHRINYLIKNSKSKEIIFEDEKQFLNINTIKDYDLAKEILKSKERF